MFNQLLRYLAVESGVNGETILDKLFPNIWAFIIQVISLVVMIVAVFFLAYKPVKKIIDKRRNTIQENLDNAEKDRKEAEIELKTAQEKIAGSDQEAALILEAAHKDAILLKTQMVEETNKEIIQLKQKAQDDIEQTYADSLDDIKKEIINVALDASKELIKREINETDNEKILDEFLNKVGEKDE